MTAILAHIRRYEGCVDTTYLDFAKEFDTVPHQWLLHKLSGLGVLGKILAWIRSFMSGRTQHVIVDDKESEWRDVVSGIPQECTASHAICLLS